MSLSFDKATSRMKVHIVKARNLCCKAREGKRQDRCGVSCSGDTYQESIHEVLSCSYLILCFKVDI